MASDYVALLFSSGQYGPTPYPNKSLVTYTRLHSIAPGSTSTAVLPITLGALARADAYGDFWLYPGTYTLALDTTDTLTYEFTLMGNAAQLTYFPQNPAASS